MPRRTPPSRGRKIDFKQWTSIPGIDLLASTNVTLLGGSLAFLIPATILRCRTNVYAAFDGTQQGSDRLDVTYGLGIVSTDAFAAGAGSVPDPASEPEFPWLWWYSQALRSELASAENVWGVSAQFVEMDTKAMRKVKPGESLIWVVETSAAAGAPATDILIQQTRVLIGT